MQCHYYDEHACRSCTFMGTSQAVQVAQKLAHARGVLAAISDSAWLEPVVAAEAAFRNKAKLVVGGHAGAATLGILDGSGHGVDLRHCGLYEQGLAEALPALGRLVDELGLEPYDVPRRRGELKYLLVTHSPDDELMVRFVLRSTKQLGLIRAALPRLTAVLPNVRVASVNLHPEHKATLEGHEEIWLTPETTLPMRVGDVTLHLRPNSFFQTNTSVAAALYAQACDWVLERRPSRLWDLYCGVGGFALQAATSLHSTDPGPDTAHTTVLGIEVSPEAVRSARRSTRELIDAGRLWAASAPQFVTGDATAPEQLGQPAPDLVVVNPPRRGLGVDLTGWLGASGTPTVIYSSCNVQSLARDLELMPHHRPVAARLFDMFPQTAHSEVLVLLQRE